MTWLERYEEWVRRSNFSTFEDAFKDGYEAGKEDALEQATADELLDAYTSKP